MVRDITYILGYSTTAKEYTLNQNSIFTIVNELRSYCTRQKERNSTDDWVSIGPLARMEEEGREIRVLGRQEDHRETLLGTLRLYEDGTLLFSMKQCAGLLCDYTGLEAILDKYTVSSSKR